MTRRPDPKDGAARRRVDLDPRAIETPKNFPGNSTDTAPGDCRRRSLDLLGNDRHRFRPCRRSDPEIHLVTEPRLSNPLAGYVPEPGLSHHWTLRSLGEPGDLTDRRVHGTASPHHPGAVLVGDPTNDRSTPNARRLKGLRGGGEAFEEKT